MLLMGPVLWAPSTGAITRVLLPMTCAFNILLAREQSSGSVLGMVHCGQPASGGVVEGDAGLVDSWRNGAGRLLVDSLL